MKTTEQLVSFSQGNMEAMMKSSHILAAGMQDLTRHIAATTQASMDEALNSFRAMAGARSIKDAMELHAALTRSAMEAAVRQTTQVADASIKVAEQAMAPIAQRVTLAAGTFSGSD